jgi:hypothetical protein
MVDRGSWRGDLKPMLNRRVEEEVIAGFRTNLSDSPWPQQRVVTIFPRQGDEPGTIVREGKQKLSSLGIPIDIIADPLDGLEA